jgi:hypothetical protein
VHLDAEYEAARLRVLLSGLALQLVTTPRRSSPKWALTTLDDHLAALAAPPAPARGTAPALKPGADSPPTALAASQTGGAKRQYQARLSHYRRRRYAALT